MHRFFVDQENIQVGRDLELSPSEAEHIRHSLRLKAGDEIIVFNGTVAYAATLTQVSANSVRAQVLREHATEAPAGPQIHLYQSLIRIPQFELVLQKATELGVSEITPVQAAYSQLQIPAHSNKLERWERIVREACKQAERTQVPEINPTLRFDSLIAAPAKPQSLRLMFTLPRQTDQAVLPTLNPQVVAKLHQATQLEVLIGPEGGFSPDEHSAATAAGWELVHLGDLVLRSETAAIAALAFIHAGLSLNPG